MGGHGEQIPEERPPVMPAVPEDADQIRRLIRDSWVKTMSEVLNVPSERLEEVFEWSMSDKGLKRRQESLAHPPTGEYTFVAKKGARVLGVCTVQRQANENGENELAIMHVAPEQTERGIGQSLWEEAQKTLDPAKDTFLWTTPGTMAADVVYPRWGFEPVEYGTELLEIKEPLERPRVKMVKRKSIDTVK